MEGFKFLDRKEENIDANEDSDSESDIHIQEEGIKHYDEHFWCKSKDVERCLP